MSEFERELRELVRDVVREEIARLRAELSAPDEYLSTEAAAQLAGVHSDTIRRWVREGRLTEHRAGRVVRVRRSDVEGLLAGGRRAKPAERPLTPEEMALRDFG